MFSATTTLSLSLSVNTENIGKIFSETFSEKRCKPILYFFLFWLFLFKKVFELHLLFFQCAVIFLFYF